MCVVESRIYRPQTVDYNKQTDEQMCSRVVLTYFPSLPQCDQIMERTTEILGMLIWSVSLRMLICSSTKESGKKKHCLHMVCPPLTF